MTSFSSFSKRERYIAIGVMAAAAIFLFDQFLYSPYAAARDSVARDRETVNTQLANADRLFERRRSLTKVLAEIQRDGLKSSRSQAVSQAQQSVLDWAKAADLKVFFGAEHDSQQNQFQVISFEATSNGTMLSLSRLLWSIETSKLPIRVNEVQLSPRKDGVDDLTLKMNLSTLCLPPESSKTRVASAEGSVRP